MPRIMKNGLLVRRLRSLLLRWRARTYFLIVPRSTFVSQLIWIWSLVKRPAESISDWTVTRSQWGDFICIDIRALNGHRTSLLFRRAGMNLALFFAWTSSSVRLLDFVFVNGNHVFGLLNVPPLPRVICFIICSFFLALLLSAFINFLV